MTLYVVAAVVLALVAVGLWGAQRERKRRRAQRGLVVFGNTVIGDGYTDNAAQFQNAVIDSRGIQWDAGGGDFVIKDNVVIDPDPRGIQF
jgi:hypothetical protein